MISLLLYALALLLVIATVIIAVRLRPARELPEPLRERLRVEENLHSDDAEAAESQKQVLRAGENAKEDWWLRFSDWLGQAGFAPRPFLLRSLALDILISILLALFLLPIVGILYFFLLHPLLTVLRVRLAIRKRAALTLLALPGFLDAVVRITRVGTSLTAAIQSATREAEGPIRDIFRQILRREHAGMPIDRAMLLIAQRYHLPELAILATVLRLNLRYGGRTDIILERLADWLRGRVSVQAELRALSAETRFSALVLSILIPGLGVYITAMNSKPIMAMWDTEIGRILLILGAGLILLGIFLIQRMSKL
jgi:tight adherence protein B